MSASVDQRNKGQSNQVSNGPSSKETVKDSDFEAYLQSQPHQGAYSSGPMSSPSVSDQTYMQSYYPQSVSFPYLGEGGAWSSGDPMGFLGSYGQVGNDYSNGTMFSGFDYSQAGFGWFPGSEYSAWVNSTQTGKTDLRGYEDYYSTDQMHAYGSMNGEADLSMQNIDQGLQSVSLSDNQNDPGLEQSASVDNSQSAPAVQTSVTQAPKKMSWASVARQPARPQPQVKPKAFPRAPVPPSKHNMEFGTWDAKNSASKQSSSQPRQAWGAPRGRGSGITPYSTGPANGNAGSTNSQVNSSSNASASSAVLDKLLDTNEYNPQGFNTNPKGARFFIIKSYSEDDIHRSIKYSIWCSTEHGNRRLHAAYKEREGKGPVYLFFSVNGSGHFCGMAQMMSAVDCDSSTGVWAQDKWKGKFEVKWIYVKDVPNNQLRHIRLENNENKPVTNSRDTQEVPYEKGKQVLKIITSYQEKTSIFDDFSHYEKRQEEEAGTGPSKKSGGGRGGYRN